MSPFSKPVARMRKPYRERLDPPLRKPKNSICGLVTFPEIEAGKDAAGWCHTPMTDWSRNNRPQAESMFSRYQPIRPVPGWYLPPGFSLARIDR